MGLDMFLSARTSVYRYSDEAGQKLDAIKALFPQHPALSQAENATVEFGIGYWRKANAIHAWFVDNVQDGKDDNEDHEVSREELQSLYNACSMVLDGRAKPEEVLPTRGGFFFGDTAYDGRYFDILEDTMVILDNALSLDASWWFTYRASW